MHIKKIIFIISSFLIVTFMSINPGIKNIFHSPVTGTDNKIQLPVEKIIDTTFVSKFVGDSIKIDISLPASYYNTPGKYYPVVYMTDGYWRTARTSDSIHQMSDRKEIPEVIVVGIGYPADYKFDSIRVRDLVIKSAFFFRCIKRRKVCLMLKISTGSIRATDTLWGASYGGHFLIYAFTEHIKQGKLFKNYICATLP